MRCRAGKEATDHGLWFGTECGRGRSGDAQGPWAPSFTPPELARFVARWAIRFPGDRVLEPACGEAEFLVAASDRLRSLGCKSAVAERNVVGCEVHEASAEKAVGRLGALGCSANIVVSDFLRLAPDPSFDVVIGNPPYVRFQSLSSDQKDAHRSHR